MKTVENFQCRVCGGTSYEAIDCGRFVGDVNTTSEGHVESVEMIAVDIGFECTTCTVTFGDPRKFTKPQPQPPQ